MTSSTVSPRPAASVSALPATADGARIINVFIKDGASAAEKLAMAHQIAQMPQVEAYHFMTKREALDSYAKRSGLNVANLPVNPLPASFQILVRDPAGVAAVASTSSTTPSCSATPARTTGCSHPAVALPRRSVAEVEAW